VDDANKAERLLQKISRLRCQRTTDPQVAAYEEAMATRGLLDFDDLLLKPLALLGERPDLTALYRERFRWISIDEYQDIDPLQYALVRLLAPPEGNLCVIGDPDQSIYRFRGADVGFFLRFQEDYPGARVVHLTRNYRSSRLLVEAACQAIRPDSLVPDRRLVAVRQGAHAPRIVVQAAASERAEAEQVVHTLETLVGGTSSFSFDSGRVNTWANDELSFEDVAILYRTDAQAAPLIEALGRAGIPYQKRSHRPLTEQPGVRALLPILKKKALERASGTVDALLERAVVEASGVELLAAAELLRPLAVRAGDDLERFLADVALGGEVDTWDPRAERVSLLTLHASKGLEFRVVFLVGCEEGLLPLTWPGAKPEEADIAEERRLFFVGITRACARLFLFHSRRPSPFLAAVEEALLERRKEPELVRRPEQMRLL
jgi:superfamily I DNA/RNA helicase